MDLTIHGRNIKVSDKLENYTRNKAERLERYLPHIARIHVELTTNPSSKRDEDRCSAQITIQHRRGAILRAEEKHTSDIHRAIDGAVEKLYRQIERFKSKRSRKGLEKFYANLEELEIAEETPIIEVEEPIIEEPQAIEEAVVLRRKTVALEPLHEHDAIEQMELLGHDFFMFLNVDTGSVSVVYRRAEQGYGILIPE
ncbi:MAG: ribosome hibernation-promoting factor, HPF/YfiA family [Phototrophicaceae bacterium]